MTHLFINSNNEYPRHIGDILLEYPDYDGINLPIGWSEVEPTNPIVAGNKEIVIETFPELIDGKYKQSWTTRPMTVEEIEQQKNPPQSWEDVKKTLGI